MMKMVWLGQLITRKFLSTRNNNNNTFISTSKKMKTCTHFLTKKTNWMGASLLNSTSRVLTRLAGLIHLRRTELKTKIRQTTISFSWMSTKVNNFNNNIFYKKMHRFSNHAQPHPAMISWCRITKKSWQNISIMIWSRAWSRPFASQQWVCNRRQVFARMNNQAIG